SAMDSVRPDLTMATPVTRPQVPVAIRAGTMACTPERNAARRSCRTSAGSSAGTATDSGGTGRPLANETGRHGTHREDKHTHASLPGAAPSGLSPVLRRIDSGIVPSPLDT